jgi:peptidoglycan hydrolase-like protein with peptidoglycan-binding domain
MDSCPRQSRALALKPFVLGALYLVLSLAAVGTTTVPARAAQSTTTPAPHSGGPSAAKKPAKKRRHVAPRQTIQKAPTPDRITEIQSALARGGYYQGDPTGKWDANTVAAMQKFQSVSGLDATGKLDALTLQKLGLGSDIAGVSAPGPVVPHSPSASNASPANTPVVTGSSDTTSNLSRNPSLAASNSVSR